MFWKKNGSRTQLEQFNGEILWTPFLQTIYKMEANSLLAIGYGVSIPKAKVTFKIITETLVPVRLFVTMLDKLPEDKLTIQTLLKLFIHKLKHFGTYKRSWLWPHRNYKRKPYLQ